MQQIFHAMEYGRSNSKQQTRMTLSYRALLVLVGLIAVSQLVASATTVRKVVCIGDSWANRGCNVLAAKLKKYNVTTPFFNHAIEGKRAETLSTTEGLDQMSGQIGGDP